MRLLIRVVALFGKNNADSIMPDIYMEPLIKKVSPRLISCVVFCGHYAILNLSNKDAFQLIRGKTGDASIKKSLGMINR